MMLGPDVSDLARIQHRIEGKIDALEGLLVRVESKVDMVNGRVKDLELERARDEGRRQAMAWRVPLISAITATVVAGIILAIVLNGIGLR